MTPTAVNDTGEVSSPSLNMKPAGTGVFMPMVGRSYSGRNKPQRRRNATTSCLADTTGQPRRNTSSRALAVQNPSSNPAWTNSANGAACAPPADLQQPSSFAPSFMSASAAMLQPALASYSAQGDAISSFAATALQGPTVLGQPSVKVPIQQQQCSPFAASLSTSPQLCPLTDLSTTSLPEHMHAALIDRVPSAQQVTLASCAPTLRGTLHQRNSAPGAVPVGVPVLQVPVDVQQSFVSLQSQMSQQDSLVSSSTASFLQHGFSVSSTDATAGQGIGFNSAHNSTSLSAPHVLSADTLLAEWNALGLSEQDLLSTDTLRETGLEQQHGTIRMQINKLSYIKQLLQLKQQHKTQQQLLQIQQQQQEQALQQQLLQSDAVPVARQSTEFHHVLQLLEPQTNSTSALLPVSPATTAPAVGSTALSTGVLDNGQNSAPLVLAFLQQQQQQQLQQTATLGPLVAPQLQAADPAALGSLLQTRMQFTAQQQPVMPAAGNIILPQSLVPAPTTDASSLASTQSLVLQSWQV